MVAFVPNSAVDLLLMAPKIRLGLELLVAEIAGKSHTVMMDGLMRAQHVRTKERLALTR